MQKIFSYDDIKSVLPYRKPMLLLDRIKYDSPEKAVGLKVLSMDEMFFQGHFPGQPIMPGVLQVEAMFQLCHFLSVDELDPSNTQDIYLKRLKRVRFRKPVSPGDRLVVEAEMIGKSEEGIEFKASTTNAAGLTCQATITVAVRPKTRPDHFIEAFDELDYSDKVAMNTLQIMDVIPHRFPFLYADYVTSCSPGRICCVKSLTGNEPFFAGYKEGYSVLASSIQCEIIAQAGAINMLSQPHNRGKIALYASINEFEAHRPLFPGDRLVCDLETPVDETKFGRGIGSIKVDGKVAATLSLSFAIV